MPLFTNKIKTETEELFKKCVVKPIGKKYAIPKAEAIIKNRKTYEAVQAETGVPWWFIGCCHYREAGLRWNGHLHNGDPLTARTKRVPEGRPLHEPTGPIIVDQNGKPIRDEKGNPKRQYTWHESALDACEKEELTTWKDWSIAGALWKLEKFNGYGYRFRGIPSPYLWSMSNIYVKGKYVADGIFDPNKVDQQLGVACILKELIRMGAIPEFVETVAQPPDKSKLMLVASEFKYNVLHSSTQVAQLQILINTYGMNIRVDGFAGTETSDALFKLTGAYLRGDPRHEK